MQNYHINSIYLATEGEGIHLGHPQVFIRFQGCAIGCLNCDSKETWEFNNLSLSFDQAWAKIKKESRDFSLLRFSITGGDPLHPKLTPEVLSLAQELKNHFPHCYINLEASGTRIVPEIFNLVDFISFDYKTPSTGVKTSYEHLLSLAHDYPGKFQVKSVVEKKADIDWAYEAYLILAQECKNHILPFSWCLTPAYNTQELFPEKRFQEVMEWNNQKKGVFRVIGQQHKWIFGPRAKQV